MIGVNGWYSAKTRTPAGMLAVGTNALLTKGSNSGMSDRPLAPAGLLASKPKAMVSHDNAMPNRANSPAAATHPRAIAFGEKPDGRLSWGDCILGTHRVAAVLPLRPSAATTPLLAEPA